MLALFAFQSAFVSVESVKQPTDTSFRTAHGSERDHARADAERRREHDSPLPEHEAGADERQEQEPRVAEDPEREHDPERERHRADVPARPVGGGQRQVDDRGREHLVDDLAVDVDVVPDQVRVERGDDGRDQSRARGQEAPSGLVDDQGRRRRHGDLPEPDRRPVAAEDPVDRDQEERVGGLRPRRRLAGDEAVRARVDEGQREAVRLLGVAGEDRAALVEQDGEARQHARREHDRVRLATRHETAAAGSTGCADSTHVRCQSSSITRHQSR